MAIYTVTRSSNNITVTMYVNVNSTISVSFTITNNRGTSGYVTISYYDNLNNNKTFSVPYYPGDVNRDAGVNITFAKPSFDFYCCFDIVQVEDCPRVPVAQITDVYVADYPVWNINKGQIAVPVYGFCCGIVYMLENSQVCETNYPLPKLGIRYTCYTENTQYAYIHTYIPYHGGSETEIDYSKIALPDRSGGALIASLGQKRGNWVTDCELGYPTTSVNLQQAGFYQLVVPPGSGTANVNVPADCSLIMIKKYGYVYFDLIYNNNVIFSDYTDGYGWSGPVKISSSNQVYITSDIMQKLVQAWYDNKIDTKTITTFSWYYSNNVPVTDPSLIQILINLGIISGTGTITVKYTNTLPANRALDFYFLNYSFKDPNTYFKFYVEGSQQTVTVNAAIVPSELTDEYCAWLNSKGISAVKEQPL